MARQLFGTDGIRGVAGVFPLDPPTAYAFGEALGEWAGRRPQPTVVIGMDTRESGPWLAEYVAGGLVSQGVTVRFAGLVTTPGVAYLARTSGFTAGVMISASHNPYADNGLKVFDHSGFKLPDAEELQLEQSIFRHLTTDPTPAPLSLRVDESLDAHYLNYLAGTVQTSLSGLRLVLDCAHGAASRLAPALFQRLGAGLDTIGCEPNGRNINDGVGALHTEALRQKVVAQGADAGIAFDGDADRAMLVSHSGKVIDGDHVLLLAAKQLLRSHPEPVVIATVMSNLGLEVALRRLGIGLVRTAVGDKYVLEEMIRRDAPIGGEQSGHVIFREFATTGDGLLTALRVLEIMKQTGQDLDALTADFHIYPQRLVNVRVRERRPLAELAGVQTEIRLVEQELGGDGRVLVRFSGTEPLARVMVEGPEIAQVQAYADRIAASIQQALC